MINARLILISVFFITALVLGACLNFQDPSETPSDTPSQSEQIAADYLKIDPTFVFDGIPETLRLTAARTEGAPSTWTFIFAFESRHAGFGDRSGQIMVQVITPHQATIRVKLDKVIAADLDGKWDMITQREISSIVGGTCQYTQIPGTARILSVRDAGPSSAACKNAVEVLFTFTPDDPAATGTYRYPDWKDTSQQLTVGGGMNPPKAWVQKQGITEGRNLRCTRSEISEGTCTPVIFSFPDINFDAWPEDCFGDETGQQVAVDASFSGQEIPVAVGQMITVTLASNQSTGFKWELISNSDESILQKTDYRYETAKITEPPTLGAGGDELWTFQALKEGKSTISLAYRRHWESVPPAETFTLTVLVGP